MQQRKNRFVPEGPIDSRSYLNQFWPRSGYSLRPSDAIWWQRSGSTLARVMACCLMASSHYMNNNIELSLIRYSDIYFSAISQKIPQLSITKFSLKIPYLSFLLNLPGANELSHMGSLGLNVFNVVTPHLPDREWRWSLKIQGYSPGTRHCNFDTISVKYHFMGVDSLTPFRKWFSINVNPKIKLISAHIGNKMG